MPARGNDEKQPSILGGTLRAVGAIACVAVAAATWLSSTTGDGAPRTALASARSRGFEEPATTGSIVKGANATRLDPCIAVSATSGTR